MSKNKEKTPAAATEKNNELVAEPVAPARKPESVVDGVFDAVTSWAAQGLGVAKRGLEASARWLDARAKLVGELASKLASSPPRATAPSTDAQSA